MATSASAEKVTNLDHVLDPTVGVFLDYRFNPDQGLHLNNKHKQQTYITYKFTLNMFCHILQTWQLNSIWHSHHLVYSRYYYNKNQQSKCKNKTYAWFVSTTNKQNK